MTRNYLEQDFEEHITEHLLNSGYNKQDSQNYHKDLCLLPDDVIAFIKASQPQEYQKLEKQYGADTPEKLCQRIEKTINQNGTLHVLRKGIKDRGAKFRLAYFKPASGMNPEHQKLYALNRFTFVRQLYYSKRNNKSLDIAIFLNGLPIITAELKNNLSGQFVEEAVKQYETDRSPNEPLFQFKRCLVHFAVDNEKVFMTTRLQGDKTSFLPFNKDTQNPINPNGHKTAYLWEDILQPDTLLDLIHNYLHVQRKSEKIYDKTKGLIKREYDVFIFPRFHQLDVVRTLLQAVKEEGVGCSYLVQHSAGSGKSNSIAWLAHQLAGFYRQKTDKERLFDSIIVVTDRKILDKQLQDTIVQFEQTSGVVHPIDLNSKQLKEKLELGKDIIVTTLQKFPVISESMSYLKGKKFAVIVDEAHSSQSGESAKHLKKVLTLSTSLEQAETLDKPLHQLDIEDEVLKEIRVRGRQPNISYFAFTATPKAKTLELFGRPDETAGKHTAFHIYSMRQAIEENFILDILKNYTTFKRYFKLVKAIQEDREYEKKKAMYLLTSYVDLQPHAIEMKTRIMLDHFLEKTISQVEGRGRAMVVTRSRLHAVKFFQAFNKIMQEKQLLFKPLVAFSGTVKDPDTLAEYTETNLNRLPSRVSIPDAFKTPDYRILIVAEKFQTGFDEPLLHTMYVDKKLDGLHAVQALSRLNRTMTGKNDTLILDFVNDTEDIREAFQDYYQATTLEEVTDPNKLYDLQNQMETFQIYFQEDIDEFALIFFNPKQPLEKLQPILDRVIYRFRQKEENEREDFRTILQKYIRFYSYVSQLITFEDIELEKLYVFSRSLNRKLPRRETRLPIEVQDAVDLDSFRIQQTYKGPILLTKQNGEVKGPTNGTPHATTEEEKELLSNIIKELNDIYGINLTEDDKVDMERLKSRLYEHEELRAVMMGNNTEANKRYKCYQVLDEILLDFVHTKLDLYKKLSEPKTNRFFKDHMYEGLKTTLSGTNANVQTANVHGA